MKPPPRIRTKPDRNLDPEPSNRKECSRWQVVEQKKLLKALKTHSRDTRGLEDIDYAFLKKHVPTRSISEITSVVEYLKNKVISLADSALKKKTGEEKKARKPIDVWTHLASAMAGTLQEPITSAFSQMFVVSSIEPRTLRNCDPPQVRRPVARTVPSRPMPSLPVKVKGPGTNTPRPVIVLKTPGPTVGPAKRLPLPSRVVRVANGSVRPPQEQLSTTAGTPPAATPTSQSAASSSQPGAAEILTAPAALPASQTVTLLTGQVTPSSGSAAVLNTESGGSSLIQTPQKPSEQHPTTTPSNSTSQSTSSGPHRSLSSSSTSQTPVPSTAPATSLPTPAAASCHSKFGCTSKYATKDSPRVFGIKSVDFEKIYRYLSVVHQPNQESYLTPMESAIVLDLLMSLPEELPLLDCNKLHHHLIKVYKCVSSTPDSKMAREMFKSLKDGVYPQTEAASGQGSSSSTNGGGKKLQPEEAESQSSESPPDEGHCPSLNPFMVPLNLLRRKSSSSQVKKV